MNNQLKHQDFALGIPSVDAQHRQLVEMINDLSRSMALGDSRPVLGSLLEKLYAFAQSHFAYEEQLMEETGFPGLADHRIEHRHYMDRLVELFHRWADGSGGFMIAVDVHDLLELWAREHIIESDQLYVHHLKSHGVE